MRRRGGYNTEKMVDVLYYNMRPDLRLHVKPRDVQTVTELIQSVEEIEEVLKQTSSEPRAMRPVRRSGVMTVTAPYDRKVCCWRCKQRGHDRFQCRNTPLKFCSYCGRDNVLTRDCTCHTSGNAPRAGPPTTERIVKAAAMADSFETSLDSSVTGECRFYGKKFEHTFLVL